MLPLLVPPVPPADHDDITKVENYHIDLKLHKEKEKNHRANIKKVFFLVLGQCSCTI
jgi:hypothetical protein